VKILIAGSAGQLGRALTVALAAHEVEAAPHQRLDITRLDDVREAIAAFAADLVINAAAYNDVDGAESNAVEAYRINAMGPRNLALATAAVGIPLLQVSTDYVFDGTACRAYHEYDRPNPLSTYGAGKLAGELAVKELNPRHYIVRTAWLFDVSGRNFLNRMLTLRHGPQVRAVDDQFSSPTYAPHLANAIAELITTEAYGTYHMTGQGGTSRFEMTRLLFSTLGLKTEVAALAHTESPAAAVRPRYTPLTTIQEPQILLPPWQEGIRAFGRALAG
jgi:dTDP-4-dehydrorhamnose reductase